MLYSSTDSIADDEQDYDADSYPAFKTVDCTIVRKIMDELDALGDPEEEGKCFNAGIILCSLTVSTSAPCALVGALTKALCCQFKSMNESSSSS